ncbi:uncharacterized protein [Argopecten irradians]|uniref:uncharacterized protein n=1 Tax=Argopecten irradians TaxID=31199 RepID=UPI00371CC86C
MESVVMWLLTGSIIGTMAMSRNYVTYSDRKAAREKVVSIKDPFLRFVLEKQILFCPHVSTCTVDHSMTPSSCCSRCSCDSASPSLEQCPDYTGKDSRFACLRPQYIYKENKTKSSLQSYLMINRCPSVFEDVRIDRLCVRGSVLHPYNMTMVLPITDTTNKITYRNVFCAICNSRQEENLIAWSANVNCTSSSTPEPKSLRELMESVASNKQCNLLFEPPRNMTLAKCDTLGLVSECNVTGRWTVFDDDMDRACTSYRSVYRSTYQNIHCYMCNVNDEPYTECTRTYPLIGSRPLPPIPTFSGAIEQDLITNLVFGHDAVGATCLPGTRYDGIMKLCREIFCSPPLIYRNGICTSIYRSVSLRRYHLNLMITPHYNVSYKWLPDPFAAARPASYIQEYLSLVLFPLQAQQCSSIAEVFAKTVKGKLNVFPKNNETRVTHVNVPVEFVVIGQQNDIATMERILYSDMEGFNTTVRNEVIYFDISPFMSETVTSIERESLTINGLELTENIQLPGFGARNDFGVCGSRMPVTTLSKFTLCSKINITMEDYNTTRVNDTLCLPQIDLCFSLDEFEYGDTYIILCSQRFFERIDKLSPKDDKLGRTEEDAESRVGLALVGLSILCLCVALVGVFVVYKPRNTLSYMLMGLVLGLILYNIVLLTVPFPFVSTYNCRITGASLQFTAAFSVSLLQLCVFHVGLMMRVDLQSQNPYILKILHASYPVLLPSIIASVTYWYVVSHSSDVTVPWISWGLPCYSAINSLSLYISCLPILTMLALSFLVSLVLAIYSYAIALEKDDVEFVHMFGFYSKVSFVLLLVQSFWYLISFARWTGNVYLFLVMNLISSMYIMICSLTDSKLKATCTNIVDNSETRAEKRASSCPCNPARRQQKDFQPIAEMISENGGSLRTSSHL